MTAEERRRRGRRPVNNLRVTAPFDGKVLDLSLLGMGVEASEDLTTGRSLRLLLRRGWRRLRIDGTVRWCSVVDYQRDGVGPVYAVYRAGIALEAPSPKAVQFLQG